MNINNNRTVYYSLIIVNGVLPVSSGLSCRAPPRKGLSRDINPSCNPSRAATDDAPLWQIFIHVSYVQYMFQPFYVIAATTSPQLVSPEAFCFFQTQLLKTLILIIAANCSLFSSTRSCVAHDRFSADLSTVNILGCIVFFFFNLKYFRFTHYDD